jgi:hypothetical protein
MMRVSIALALILATAGCAMNPVADEPQDLVANDQALETLRNHGWIIGAPIDSAAVWRSHDPGAPSATNGGQSWAAFLSALEPEDELRQVRSNAGQGYAIFRDGRLLSLYLSTIH